MFATIFLPNFYLQAALPVRLFSRLMYHVLSLSTLIENDDELRISVRRNGSHMPLSGLAIPSGRETAISSGILELSLSRRRELRPWSLSQSPTHDPGKRLGLGVPA